MHNKRILNCYICDRIVIDKLLVWNNEIACSEECWEILRDNTQEYDISFLLENNK